MRIGIIGYGKMGKAIEKIALERGHSVPVIVDGSHDLNKLMDAVDVAIEFTQPDAAYKNLVFCMKNNVKVISGTTGWLNKYEEIVSLCLQRKGTFLYASNFSVSVNVFFELNDWLAKRMKSLNFDIKIEEIHHTQKKDAPSGTSITLAEDILKENKTFQTWTNEFSPAKNTIPIISKRIDDTPGTHIVSYTTDLETIRITHEASDRSIFAKGAVDVAEWIQDKRGVLNISDFINQI